MTVNRTYAFNDEWSFNCLLPMDNCENLYMAAKLMLAATASITNNAFFK